MISLMLIAAVTVASPDLCPKDTVTILANDDGSVTCFTEKDLQASTFDPEPNDPPRSGSGSGTRHTGEATS